MTNENLVHGALLGAYQLLSGGSSMGELPDKMTFQQGHEYVKGVILNQIFENDISVERGMKIYENSALEMLGELPGKDRYIEFLRKCVDSEVRRDFDGSLSSEQLMNSNAADRFEGMLMDMSKSGRFGINGDDVIGEAKAFADRLGENFWVERTASVRDEVEQNRPDAWLRNIRPDGMKEESRPRDEMPQISCFLGK